MRHAPPRLRHLTLCSPVDSTVWGGLGGVVYWGSTSLGQASRESSLRLLPALSLIRLVVKDVSSQPPVPAAMTLRHDELIPLEP